jgi:hypothetical protein
VPTALPENVFQLPPDDPKRVAEEKTFKEKADKEKADEDKRIADARKHVEDLSDRFANWYYVTPGESFRSIRLDRAALIGPKAPKTETPGVPGTPGGLPSGHPSIPGVPSLPPALNP